LSKVDLVSIIPPILTTFFNSPYFRKIDHLLAYRHKESLLILDFKFNQTDPAGSMNHLCCGLEEVSRSTRSQEVNILLERNGWFSKAVPCCFTGLVGDGEDGSSMSHLVNINGFLSNGESGAGETREEFNEFHPNAFGKSVFAIDFFGNGLQDVFWGFIHLDFSFLSGDFIRCELFFLVFR
jgi:hypothetical protein